MTLTADDSMPVEPAPPTAGERRRRTLATLHHQRRESRVRRLENVALDLFLVQGFDEVTVEQIAQAAGLSRRSFYRYYESPADILICLFRRSMARWTAALNLRPADEPLLTAFLATDATALNDPEHSGTLNRALQVLHRAPAMRAQVLGLYQQHCAELYRDVVADRLQAGAGGAAAAGAVAAALAAVKIHLADEAAGQGRLPTTTELADALGLLFRALSRDTPA